MVQSQRFSGGVEVASSVTSSDLLRRSWSVITSHHAGIVTNIGVGLSWKVYKEQDSDVTIIAFEATLPECSNLHADLVSSVELREKNFLLFQKNSVFSINRTASSLFFQNKKMLDQLKSEINSSPLLIITGLALGGSIASLFTLSLLDSIDLVPKEKESIVPKKNRLCITFGSPLVGDKGFQEAISRSSTWNSCFLHVVSYKDPVPKRFITNHTAPASASSPHTSSSYMPFGTFLLCSESDTYSTCFENPDSILTLLKAWVHDQNQVFRSKDYGYIVESLSERAILKDSIAQAEGINFSSSMHASISLQLRALGWTPSLIQNTDVNTLGTMVRKKTLSSNVNKLNMMKINMAQLEWYKKTCKKENTGYYDCYKVIHSTREQNVVHFHKSLKKYWEEMVEEAETKPQKEGAYFRTRWLGAGTNYRRMVEPLDIAQYYANGGKDYETRARSKHYQQLEDWLLEGTTTTKGSDKATKDNVEAILTIDSCFWAHVEEALLSCKQLSSGESSVMKRDEAASKLLQFENYVYGQLTNYAVSPEIFLEKSSYIKWWREYKAIKGTAYSSALARFMSNAYNYNVQYAGGAYNFD